MVQEGLPDVLSRNVDKILSKVTTSDSEFLAQISHELRTPLNGIIGVIDIMAREEDQDSDIHETYMRTLQQSCRTLMSVVNRLQDLSHLQTFPKREASVIFDLEAVVTGISQGMQYHHKDSVTMTQLSIDFDSRIPCTVKADLTKIQQTLGNLCRIAAFVSKTHCVTIDVTLKYLLGTHCTLTFQIKMENVDSNVDVFQPQLLTIESVDLFQTDTRDNLLIGMTICRKFLNELGSDLDIHRVEGNGLLFVFDLTLEWVPGSPKRSPLTKEEFKTVKVLIAEDNPVNTKILEKMLSILGVRAVTSVANGELALQKLRLENFDIVLMDLDMAVMSGYDSAWNIRNVLKNDVPIIALSADSTNAAKQRCRDVKMSDFFSKPVTVQTLSEMISKWRRERGSEN